MFETLSTSRRCAKTTVFCCPPMAWCMTVIGLALTCTVATSGFAQPGQALNDRPVVRTSSGLIAGISKHSDGVLLHEFMGIPFARPPLGDLRWQPPQPAVPWIGVREAQRFGSRCMQRPLFGELKTRASGMSEDCLYLNVWTPARAPDVKLPVLVYIYGGAFKVGDGSQSIYDQASMAAHGIVAVTFNYRLNLFGFLALPALAAESTHHSAGDYGLLDQVAALRWVRANISQFGGDPAHVTIAGQSSGSVSVSAQMASPLARHLVAGAIGESGAMIAPIAPTSLATAKRESREFMSAAKATSLEQLRRMPADDLIKALGSWPHWSTYFAPDVDGYFLLKPPTESYQQGSQAHVPLLAGTNSQEAPYIAILKRAAPTVSNYHAALHRLFGPMAPRALALYPASDGSQVIASATALASDMFTAHCTWLWTHLQARTSGQPVYQYYFTGARPTPRISSVAQSQLSGAPHGDELAFAYGNLDAIDKASPPTPNERKVSRVMQGYFVNFIKTGNPNGSMLPSWPAARRGGGKFVRQVVGLKTFTDADQGAARNSFLVDYYKTHPNPPYVGPVSNHHRHPK